MSDFLKMWNQADADGDGRLSKREFIDYARRQLDDYEACSGFRPHQTQQFIDDLWLKLTHIERQETGQAESISMQTYSRYVHVIENRMLHA